MSDSFVSSLGVEVWRLLRPLAMTVDDPSQIGRLLASIGVTLSDTEMAAVTPVVQSLGALATRVETLLASPDLSFDDARALLDIARQAFDGIRGLEQLGAAAPERAGFGKDLADRLLSSYLSQHLLLRSIAGLLTLIEFSNELHARPA